MDFDMCVGQRPRRILVDEICNRSLHRESLRFSEEELQNKELPVENREFYQQAQIETIRRK